MSKVHADIEALKALHQALPLFVGRQRDGMEVAEREIRRTLELLNQAEWNLRADILRYSTNILTGLPKVYQAIDQGQDNLQRAQYYLNDLRGQAERSRYEDLKGLAETLGSFNPIISRLQDTYHLYRAIERLGEIQRWQREVNEIVEWYDGQAQRFGKHLGMEMPRVNLFLDGRIKGLEAFYAAQIPNTKA